jgi:DNA-dependent protein kinase catalytic subunit
MKQYKDDLMSSCLQLVLSLPNELVLCDIDVIIPALKVNETDRVIQYK